VIYIAGRVCLPAVTAVDLVHSSTTRARAVAQQNGPQ
jgi:hypothetical protein